MFIYNNLEEFEEDWEDLPFLLVIISNDSCNVCKSIVRKIQDFLMIYPEIEIGYINIDNIPEATSYFNAFSNPLVIFYVEGKEVFREGRYIKMSDLERSIVKHYQLLYGELDG